jgi:NAD(P) transhydrogenase subunit beta
MQGPSALRRAPVFVRDNSQMLFGDAKQRIEDILSVL